MTVFTVHQQLIVMIIHIVCEIGALIFSVAHVLIHLEFLSGRPLALNALGLDLRAALFASISTALSRIKQGQAVVEVSAEEASILIYSCI